MDETAGKEAVAWTTIRATGSASPASHANQEEDVGSEQTGTGGRQETELDTRTNQGPL